MSSINIKPNKDSDFSSYPALSSNSKEIDLLHLVDILWRAKTRIIAIAFGFAVVGLLASFLMPQKWTSQAVITTAEPSQWQELEKTLVALRVLDVDVSVKKSEVFTQFIKKFNSLSLLEEYLRTSPVIMDQLKGAEIDPLDLHRAIVGLSDKMKAVDNNFGKKNEPALFTSWTLSFTGPNPEEAQKVLKGYIDYISAIVVKETLDDMRNRLDIKTHFEKEKLALELIKLKNQLDAKINRLHYSLEIATAAGIAKPVYSNGQAVKDDPDFSIALGADGIAKKLQIEKGVTDLADINGDLRNLQYHVQQLTALNISDVSFEPFKYQLTPSLPVKKDGPGKALIILLAGLVGGMVGCGAVLLQNAMLSRKLEEATPLEEQLA
ncbi:MULTISPECIES: LPS O-antigen length regulator Wzz(fepE) [Pseudocitrobacter]|uniref:LPS O-antigen subunit length determinant protein (WzzB/FepE family) n=1 Tax=Pseudocitrobacter faecalis TaxID=1398493 RepID=A0ABX9G5B8_9ENTR|nr:LPS O-antigen length regulator Wzz(fepE) [Pseudocitrobacter sp. RIT 415]RAU51113.1 LPS O-antigen length regulator [Pseudocitrobacter sp. RIT 415]RBP13693.1 LPS O-antigen subunit length determinant protein (WzzB/FepE family) [Pseudocitrobacter faecalis]